MTHPILISSQDPSIKRSESPETILDSEEERQEYYVVQREKRRRRKMQKRTSESGEGSGSGGGGARRAVSGVEDDSVRFLGAKRGRREQRYEDDEIEVIGVIPSAPVLRAPPVAEYSNAKQGMHNNADTSADDEAPSSLRANLAKFKYAHPPRDAPLPTSRAAAVAALKARTAPAAGESSVAGPSSTGSRKRAVTGKTRVPDMPVEPEQVRELDACVVCAMAFDRRKTAKTRWVSPRRAVTKRGANV